MRFGFPHASVIAAVRRQRRKLIAALLGSALIATFLYYAVLDLGQDRIDDWIQRPMPRATPLKYHVTIESIDEELGQVKVSAQFELSTIQLGLLKEQFQAELGQFPEFWQYDKIGFLYGPFVLQDFTEDFYVQNMWAFAFPAKPKMLPPRYPTQEYSDKQPGIATSELSLLGEPKLYPFDRYLFLGEVYCNVLGTMDGKRFSLIPLDYYSIRSREPAFILRPPARSELENWPTLRPIIPIAPDFKPNWFNRFALIAERPLFVRVLAVFLFIVALISTFLIAILEDRRRLVLDTTGYLLSLWAMRSVLSAWGPTTPTLVDYAVLGLYCLHLALLAIRFFWEPAKSSRQQ